MAADRIASHQQKLAHLARPMAGPNLTEVERLTSRRLRQLLLHLFRHRAKGGTHARYRAIEATLAARKRKTPPRPAPHRAAASEAGSLKRLGQGLPERATRTLTMRAASVSDLPSPGQHSPASDLKRRYGIIAQATAFASGQ